MFDHEDLTPLWPSKSFFLAQPVLGEIYQAYFVVEQNLVWWEYVKILELDQPESLFTKRYGDYR